MASALRKRGALKGLYVPRYVNNPEVVADAIQRLWPLFKDIFDVINSFEDLELKLTYVGSAKDETYAQVLESVLVGPINGGNYCFVFEINFRD
ncbi:probable histone chaperone ASF1A [Tanacetum coccineum]